MNIKTALVLAPHPDDGEFGCGGTIKKLTENGSEFTMRHSPLALHRSRKDLIKIHYLEN